MSPRTTFAIVTALSAAILWTSGTVQAGSQNEQAKIIARDGEEEDWFGRSVANDGDILLIGAYYDDDLGIWAGSGYAYQRDGDGWIEQGKLLASDGTEDDFFGYSVAIDGYTAVIGAFQHDHLAPDAGAAYVYVLQGDTWVEQAELLAGDGEEGDRFGYSVDVSGDYAVISAYYDGDLGAGSGSAYIFQRVGQSWVEQAKLTASDGAAGDLFGYTVRIDGDYAIVGAPVHDTNGLVDAGAAYVFVRQGENWVQQAKLFGATTEAGDQFGVSVDIDGDTAAIGAYYDDDLGIWSGSAYVYARNGEDWFEQAKITAADGSSTELFGYTVSIEGPNLVVGAYWDNESGLWSGAAYLFNQNAGAWRQVSKLSGSDTAAYDEYGKSVSISGGTIVVGAMFNDHKALDAGAAYAFVVPNPDFDTDGDIDLADFDVFVTCTGGPHVTTAPLGCQPGEFATADLDTDGDVDASDFAMFQLLFTLP